MCNKTIVKNYNYSCASRPNFDCGCIATLNTKCIDYYGEALESIGVPANTHVSLETILTSLNTNLISGVVTENSDTISFSGAGTSTSPLTATLAPLSVLTLYNSDGSITDSSRIVTVEGTSLQFNYPVQGTFEVAQQNIDPNYTTLLRIRNGGGASGFIASVNNDAQYLKLGQYGSKLQGANGLLDLGFSGGVKLVRGDDSTSNFSRLVMAPGTSSAPSFIDVASTGSAGVSVGSPVNTNTGGVSLTTQFIQGASTFQMIGTVSPTDFTITRRLLSPTTNLILFNINENGTVSLPTVPNAAFIKTDVAGVLSAGSPMSAIADATDATDLLTKFNILLAELRSAGLLLP